MEKRYEILDEIKSDVMFRAYGKNFEEMLENAGEALFSIVCDIENVEEKEVLIVEVDGENEKELLHNFLSKLLTIIDTENMFFKRFAVLEKDQNDGMKFRVECHGEEIRDELILTVAKAVTYYKYSVEEKEDGWIASVVVDI